MPGIYVSNNTKSGHIDNSIHATTIALQKNDKSSANFIFSETNETTREAEFIRTMNKQDSLSQLPGCDTIFLTDSTAIIAQVIGYRDGFYVYKKCDPSCNSADSIQSEKVLVIRRDIANETAAAASENRRTDPIGLIGFLFLFTAWIAPTPIISIILGAISVNKQTKRPNEFKNKSFGYISLFAGVVLLVLWILLILYVLAFVIY